MSLEGIDYVGETYDNGVYIVRAVFPEDWIGTKLPPQSLHPVFEKGGGPPDAFRDMIRIELLDSQDDKVYAAEDSVAYGADEVYPAHRLNLYRYALHYCPCHRKSHAESSGAVTDAECEGERFRVKSITAPKHLPGVVLYSETMSVEECMATARGYNAKATVNGAPPPEDPAMAFCRGLVTHRYRHPEARAEFADWLDEQGRHAEATGQRWLVRHGKWSKKGEKPFVGGWYHENPGAVYGENQVEDWCRLPWWAFDPAVVQSSHALTETGHVLAEYTLLRDMENVDWDEAGEPAGRLEQVSEEQLPHTPIENLREGQEVKLANGKTAYFVRHLDGDVRQGVVRVPAQTDYTPRLEEEP